MLLVNVRHSHKDESFTVHRNPDCIPSDRRSGDWRCADQEKLDQLASTIFLQACLKNGCWPALTGSKASADWHEVRPVQQSSVADALTALDGI